LPTELGRPEVRVRLALITRETLAGDGGVERPHVQVLHTVAVVDVMKCGALREHHRESSVAVFRAPPVPSEVAVVGGCEH